MELPRHERNVAKWIVENAEGICVDVGAGTGVHTKVMAMLPKVKVVYAFEPIPYNVEQLKKIKSDKVVVMPFALGKEEGTLRLYAKDVNKPTMFQWVNASAIVAENALGHEYESYIDVPVKPLNKVIDHADFIKIDVEGMEYDVLLGAKGVYENAKMVIELHGWGNYEIKDLLDLLSETHEIVNKLPEKIVIAHAFLIPLTPKK